MKFLSFAFWGKLIRLLENKKKLRLFVSNFFRYPFICLRVMPSFEHYNVIQSLQPDLILDVGFNKGQFSALCSILYKNTAILAFDPLKYSIYSNVVFMKSVLGPRFDFLNCALSDRNTIVKMKESISSDSSSLLAPSEYNLSRYPSASERGRSFHVVEARLSDLVDISLAKRSLLKLDVQGYEHKVIQGISDNQFKSIQWIYLELSDVEMYRGQKSRIDIHDLLLEKGYTLSVTANVYRDEHDRIVYCDCLYTRMTKS